MTEKLILLIFSAIMIFLFSLNFSSKWSDKHYNRLKDKDRAWFWLRIFKVQETEENYVRFLRGLSVFVIVIMIVTIIFTLMLG